MERQLRKVGSLLLAAPTVEQSGVGHSITYLTPLTCKKVFDGSQFRGWSVDGSPADCVKLGLTELADEPIDYVVSGINGGLNAGINVLYSGTVAAAIEGAFFRKPSFAVSLEYDDAADFDSAAQIAWSVIESLIAGLGDAPRLFNINIPTAATALFRDGGSPQVHIVPMGTQLYWARYIRRQDPKGRDYYWTAVDKPPPPTAMETDVEALWHGHVTVTPLSFDMTDYAELEVLRREPPIRSAGDSPPLA